MPRFTFVETCRSFPTYEVDADTLEQAVERYNKGGAELVREPVEENFLIRVEQDGKEVPIPEELKYGSA